MDGLNRVRASVSALFISIIFFTIGKLIARRFIVFGGVAPALVYAFRLCRDGRSVTLAYVGEHAKNIGEASANTAIIATLVRMRIQRGLENISIAIKPSSIGLDIAPAVFRRNLKRIIEAAGSRVLTIEIDAETRASLLPALRVVKLIAMSLPKHIIFRLAFQMHTPKDMFEALIAEGILDFPLRVVTGSGLYDRGAPEVDTEEIERRRSWVIKESIKRGKTVYVAVVRDAARVNSVREFVDKERVDRKLIAFQFLDGPFGRSLAKDVVEEGKFAVHTYVTFAVPEVPHSWKGYTRRRIKTGIELLLGSS